VPKELVQNLGTIWGALSCGFDVDPEKFGQLCQETEKIYFHAEIGVGWFSLPPTLHKILKHGNEIISECPLPIGLTNEEASEANNKYIRSFRLNHSRKNSWRNGIKDVFHRLMDISDPCIQSSFAARSDKKRARRNLSPEILALLKPPQIQEEEEEEESSSENESGSDNDSF